MHRFRIITALCLLGLLCAAGPAGTPSPDTAPSASTRAASAPATKPGPIKVLFIGNSYTGFCQMTTMVELLSRAMDPARPIKASQVSPGGYTFQEHWEIAERARKKGVTENVTLKTIRKGGWDVIVLQSYLDVLRTPEAFQKFGRLLAGEVRKVKARLVFYETWPHRKSTVPAPDAIAKYNAQYFSLARATGGTVSPVGIAFEMVKTRKPEMGRVIHYGKAGNDKHPSYVGAYLIASIHVATIYGKSPVGLPATLYRSAGDRRRNRPLIKIPPDTAKFLQQVAADAIAQAGKIAADLAKSQTTKPSPTKP